MIFPGSEFDTAQGVPLIASYDANNSGHFTWSYLDGSRLLIQSYSYPTDDRVFPQCGSDSAFIPADPLGMRRRWAVPQPLSW